MARNAQVVAHVELSVKEALAALAQDNERSLSQYAELILLKHLQQKGRLPTKKSKPGKSTQ